MLICIFGMPAALTYWAGLVVRTMAEFAVGEFHYIEPLELDALRVGVAARNQRPIVLFSDSPDAGIRNSIIRSGARILTLFEEITDVVGYCQISRNLKLIDSIRFTTHCLSCIHDLYIYENADFISRSDLTTVASFVDRLNILYDFNLSNEKKTEVLQRLLGNVIDLTSISAEESLRQVLPLAREPGGFDEDLREQADFALLEMLGQYSSVRDRKPIAEITWPRTAFLDGDNPGSPPPARLDLTGRARHLFFGPYLHVPPGSWRATIAFGIDENYSGNQINIDVSEMGKQLAVCQVSLPASGRYMIELEFETIEARRFMEIRGMLLFGAIEGWFSLLWVKLARR